MADPLFHTTPAEGATNRLAEVSEVADLIGLPLLPWHRGAIGVSSEYDPETGWPTRRRALWTVPRQSGKSVGVGAMVIERALREPGLYGVYVAQSREAGRRRLRTLASMLMKSRLDVGAKFRRGVGSEALEFSNGSLIELMAPTESSVHGDSLDLAVVDEVWAVLPTVLYGGILPAMQARPAAQVLMISTAGTLESELLNDLRDRGRADPEGRMTFVEYGLPEDAHPYDETKWAEWHPGIPVPISVDVLREASEENPLPEFLRSEANRTTSLTDPVWEAELWANQAATRKRPESGMALAVDRSEQGSAIAGAFKDESGWHLDLIDYREGAEIDWIPERLAALVTSLDPSVIAVDGSGPAAAIAPEIQELAESRRIPFRPMSRSDRCKADGFAFEQLRAQTLTHGRSAVLDESQSGTPARRVGDLWLFDRGKAVLDPAPIISASMALYSVYEVEILDPKPGIFV